MLQINDITYRINDRVLLDGATAMIPNGHKVGLVGRNGAGKSTLLAIIAGLLMPETGEIGLARGARIGRMLQEAPDSPVSLVEYVLAADKERARLLAEAETAHDADRIAEIQLRLTDIGAHDAPARAATILSGLGFDEDQQARPLSEYSGGWRMRVALASLLFSEPDVLLLDEPTNYLDLEGALWLESYLQRYPRTVLVVSHDRGLLNRAVQSILHLSECKLTVYSGGYDQFERQRRERQALQVKLKKRQEDSRRHMEAFVERFRAKASKARQAQSRLKALARMEPIPDIIAERIKPFRFPSPEKPFAPPLIQFEQTAVGYDGVAVLRGIDLRLDPDDRIGLLGANGNGKSTFAKLLADRLAPLDGRKLNDKRIKVAYFAQHQLDELDPASSPYDHIRALMAGSTQAQTRTYLGSIGFGADLANIPAESLSGGEKARLLLALATFGGAHLLILDEPTNHLDIESREALLQALNEYDGAVILISHDHHLIEAAADRLWLVADATVTPFDGDMSDYRKLLLDARRARDRSVTDKKKATRAAGEAQISQADRRREAARLREKLAPLKRVAREAEARIEGLRREIASIEERLSNSALYSHEPDAAAALAKARADAGRELKRAEDHWLSATEAYEAARQSADEKSV